MPPGRVSQRQSDRRSATRPVEGARGGGASYEREDRPARQRTAVPQRMYGRPAPSTSAAGGRRSETQQGSAIGSHRGRGRRTAEEDDADVSRDRRNDISAEIDDEDEEGGEDADEDADADADDDDDNATAHADGDAWKVALMGKPKLKTTERAKKAALALGKDEVKARANDLVRFALFAEHRRMPVRRDDIYKKVLSKDGQRGKKDNVYAFPIIFNRAQKILRFTFGYELAEVRARGTDNEQIINAQTQAQTLRGEGNDDGNLKKGASNSWVVRSVLPPKVIARMNRPQANLADRVSSTSPSVIGSHRDKKGVMLDWSQVGSELGSMGLLFLVLSLVLVNGRVLADDALRLYLRRLSLDPGEPLPEALQPNRGTESRRLGSKYTLEDWLDELVRHAYLERNQANNAATSTSASHQATLEGRRTQAHGGNSRKNRGSGGADSNTVQDIEWRWGARAEAEISEKAVASFISDVFLSEERQTAADAAEQPSTGAQDTASAVAGSSRSAGRSATGIAASPEAGQAAGPPRLSAAERRQRREKRILEEIERVAGSQLIA